MGFPSFTATAEQITLAWDASTDPTIVGYNVYYGSTSREYTNNISVGQNTTVTISNLAGGVPYYFAATAMNSIGLESTFSSEVTYIPKTTAPTQLLLSWAPQTNSVTLYQSTDLLVWRPLTNISGLTGSLPVSNQPGAQFFMATSSGPLGTTAVHLSVRPY